MVVFGIIVHDFTIKADGLWAVVETGFTSLVSIWNKLILLNIIFHALMGRFQLELFIFITFLSFEWDDGGKIGNENN